jgi:hypothetical protein
LLAAGDDDGDDDDSAMAQEADKLQKVAAVVRQTTKRLVLDSMLGGMRSFCANPRDDERKRSL